MAPSRELHRLRRAVWCSGWLGLSALFAVLLNTVQFSNATAGSTPATRAGRRFPSL